MPLHNTSGTPLPAADVHAYLLPEHRDQAFLASYLVRRRCAHGYNTITSATHAGRFSPSIS